MTQSSTLDPMQAAFRRLRDDKSMSAEERGQVKATLLSGHNAAWAWFALKDIPDWDDEQTIRLCNIIAKAGDGHIIIWTLQLSRLNRQQRELLKAKIINLKDRGFAHEGLAKVHDWSEQERERLDHIAMGDMTNEQ